MKKDVAIKLLGGTPAKAAAELRITRQAFQQWPADLPIRLEDRVLAAQARKHLSPALLGVSEKTIKAKSEAWKQRMTGAAPDVIGQGAAAV